MNLIKALILGIVQGLTEFLPVSSTAHLTLVGKMLDCVDPNHPEQWTAFIAVMQLGTLAAVLVYFAPDLLAVGRDFIIDNIAYAQRRSPIGQNARLGWCIIVGSIPIVVIGYAFKKVIEGPLTKNLYVIAGSLIGLALILFVAEIYGRRARSIEEVTLLDAIIVGCAEVFALIPGASRSGTTITAALFTGLTRPSAARFSFLLSIPAIGGSGLLEFVQSYRNLTPQMIAALVVSTAASAIVGYLSIAFLMSFLQTHSTYIFIGYRIAIGIVIFALLMSGRIAP